MKRSTYVLTALAFAGLLLFFLPICGCSLSRQMEPTPTSGHDTTHPEPLSNPPVRRDKIVTVDLDIASDEPAAFAAQTRSWTADSQGYVERQFLGDDRMTASLRIPSSKLEAFLERVRNGHEVIRESRHAEDVTGARADLEARLRNARTQEERLLAILRDSAAALDDVLAVEQEIARTRERIETMQAALDAMVDKIEYATVNITSSRRPDSIAAHPWATIQTSARGGIELLQLCAVGLVATLLQTSPTLVMLLLLSWLAYRAVRHLRRGSAIASRDRGTTAA